jgi:hypothetical protein
LLDHIRSTRLAVGVVAERSFDADERFYDVVFEITRKANGVIFNGNEFLDASGEAILETG